MNAEDMRTLWAEGGERYSIDDVTLYGDPKELVDRRERLVCFSFEFLYFR